MLARKLLISERKASYRDHTSENTSTSSSSATVDLPEYEVGDVIVLFFYQGGNDGTLDTPSGWTLIEAISPADDFQIAAYYRQMDGTEGTTITLSYSGGSSSTRNISSRMISVKNVDGDVEGDLTETADVTTGTFPSVSTSWGSSKSTFAIAGHFMRDPAAFDDDVLLDDGWTKVIPGANLDLFAKEVRASSVFPIGASATLVDQPAVQVLATVAVKGDK